MSQTVTVEHRDRVAVVTIDNPPVNALGYGVRAPLAAALEALAADANIEALVLACAGRTFVAGADITEFGKPLQKPELRDIIVLLETIRVPTVAAIHGTALGGGLELALGCHFRVCDRAAKLGLPEVKLGLLPGGGGTVRLPRLVGPEKALSMIVSGTPIGAAEALAIGLADALVEGNLIEEAVAFARRQSASGKSPMPVRDRDTAIAGVDLGAFDSQAAALLAKARGLDAPAACVRSVRNAVTLPFETALVEERALFKELVSGDQSRAQRHLFFAEREAGKVPGIGKDVTVRPVRRVGIIGAGTMGSGIAMAFINGSLPVALVEADEAALARGMETIRKTYSSSVARGSLDQQSADRRLAMLAGGTHFAALADCDLIIEAAFEDMAVKQEIFRKLDAVARPGAILATNTSYLDVDAIAAATSRTHDVLGLHFFSPANIMKLLEIVRARETAPDVIATALSVARTIGKVPVVVGVCHGFVGNRMLQARGAENEALLMEGARIEDVDTAFRDFGWPMGPFEMADLAGLDIGWRNRKATGRTAAVADALCEQGRFGQKSGKGFYRYEPGSRTPIPDPEVAELIVRKAREAGITPKDIAADEIIERTLYPLINEGTKILEEGIAIRSSDIDIVWTQGYGFPIGTGGPMFYAGTIGHRRIAERLRHWHERTGRAIFEPSALLLSLAANTGTDPAP